MFSRKSKSSSSMEVKSQFPERDYNSKPSSLPAVVEGQYNQVVSDPEELRANHIRSLEADVAANSHWADYYDTEANRFKRLSNQHRRMAEASELGLHAVRGDGFFDNEIDETYDVR